MSKQVGLKLLDLPYRTARAISHKCPDILHTRRSQTVPPRTWMKYYVMAWSVYCAKEKKLGLLLERVLHIDCHLPTPTCRWEENSRPSFGLCKTKTRHEKNSHVCLNAISRLSITREDESIWALEEGGATISLQTVVPSRTCKCSL